MVCRVSLTCVSVVFSKSLWCFFFFSSRRRHTRLQGDWSSDVCSSDLDVFSEPEEALRLLHKWQLTEEIEEEVQWKRRDQRLITVRLSGRVLRTENQRAARLEVIAEDVTERRALEEQLRQAQKIEAVGQLAGGMAPEFTNYL